MAAIKTTFGEGGSGLSPGGNGTPGIATVLRDIATDLATLKGGAVPAFTPSGALPAFTDPPTAGEMAALRTLVNELRTEVIAIHAREVARAGVTISTTAP